MKAGARWLRRVLLALAFPPMIAASFVAVWLSTPMTLRSSPVELSIEPGTSPREVAGAWERAGVDVPAAWLYAWFRASGDARRIRAGSYAVETGATPRSLLSKMVQGDETRRFLRFGEGWTFAQWRDAIAAAPGLRPVALSMSDADLMTAIGEPGVTPEGRFFPDTYSYGSGVSDLAVLRRAHAAMRRRLALAWEARAPDLPLHDEAELLVLASIVEKESGIAADRARIAGVFANRLRAGMPLQSDPTVIYGLGSAFDGNLRRRDLQADTPFNTYTRIGLPPAPIAAPSVEALTAAAHPEAGKSLYFVSRGDGSSVFSETLADHEHAVDRYQRRPAAASSPGPGIGSATAASGAIGARGRGEAVDREGLAGAAVAFDAASAALATAVDAASGSR